MTTSERAVHIVGGGLAGSEAAWQLAERGHDVVLHEMRPVRGTEAHKTDRLAELVCSNTFKSTELSNAHGLLKAEMRTLGRPFWLAGGYGSAGKLREALEEGAAGVQVGTAFALSDESGLREDLKATLVEQARASANVAFTDPLASPTGFPFKVAQLAGTSSDAAVYQARERVCDLGYLREAYLTPEGAVGYRCAAEPVGNYQAKNGAVENTAGRKCLCNALMANVGYAQIRSDGAVEPALVTAGDDLNSAAQFLAEGATSYSAADVVSTLLSAEES